MSFTRFMMKKPIAQIQAECGKSELKRTLSAANLVSLGIGCIIGTGIFVMTGTAAAQHAGPAIVISFVLAGICCAFAALCYAELASTLPVSGSAYSYAYASLGEIFAWIMGWLLLLEYGIAASTVSVGWSGYVVSFLGGMGVHIPPEWTAATGTKLIGIANEVRTVWKPVSEGLMAELSEQGVDVGALPVVTAIFNLPAAIGILGATSLLIFGIKESATVNNVIVFIKVAVILLFIAIGFFYVNPENWTPFIPASEGPDVYGWDGVFRAASIIFFAYVGFEAVSTAAQEAKNPQRDIPIGILGSLVVCTALYILVSFVLTGIVNYRTLNVPDPIAVAVDAIGLGWFSVLVKIGAIAGLSSVMLVLLYGQTRIFYTMARDGLLPPVFSRVHPKYQTPWINTLLVGVIAAIVAGMTPISDLGDLVNLGTLMAFAIICFSVLYLRIKEPALPRPFRAPFGAVTPVLGMLCCAFLISKLSHTFITLLPYFALGFLVYFGYGQFNSKLRKIAAQGA